MNQVNCPVCGNKCIKAGKTKAGSQRWLCRKCNSSVTHKIDNSAKELQIFLDWLFGKESQSSMPGDGRTFRRKTAKYWNIWPMPPKVEDSRDVLYLDGIYLGRKACILICCDDKYVLGWYLCRYEYAAAWTALMKRIAEYSIVGKIRRNGFSQRDVDRQWNQIVNMIRKKQISGVVVANMAAISSSVADAYFKVGLVIEAGGIVVTVDEGRLDMHIKKGA